jgi:hypothetical protein
MAYDLIFGKTSRNWSCGNLVVQPQPDADRPWKTNADPAELGEVTRKEITANMKLAIQLSKAGRLPQADKEQFSRFHRRWTDAYSARKGKWKKQDVLPLWNFREANKKLGARLKAFEIIAKTPAKADPSAVSVGPQNAMVRWSPEGSSPAPLPTPWAFLIGIAATLLSIGMFGRAAGGFR